MQRTLTSAELIVARQLGARQHRRSKKDMRRVFMRTSANFKVWLLVISLIVIRIISQLLTDGNTPENIGVALHSVEELREKVWSDIPRNLSDEQVRTLLIRLQKSMKVTKYILVHVRARRQLSLEKSVCGNCEVTYHPEMIHHPETKAVVVYYNTFNWTYLTSIKRRPDQLFVWCCGESPHTLSTVRKMSLRLETKFKFNLTQTYRRDSGVYQPYGKLVYALKEYRSQGLHQNITTILKKKRKLAVAVVSNCDRTSGAKARLKLIQKMKSLGLELDTFGACFKNKLKERRQDFWKILENYKFFFAIENTFHCRDYITEKFTTNSFRASAVPVALGPTKADYEAIAPKDSFIFLEDFPSISHLVKYLQYLDKHDDEYLKYFKWIEKGRSTLPEPRATGYCRLCRMLHGINVDDITEPGYNAANPAVPLFTDDIAPRTVKDLRRWVYSENEECVRGGVDSVKDLLL